MSSLEKEKRRVTAKFLRFLTLMAGTYSIYYKKLTSSEKPLDTSKQASPYVTKSGSRGTKFASKVSKLYVEGCEKGLS